MKLFLDGLVSAVDLHALLVGEVLEALVLPTLAIWLDEFLFSDRGFHRGHSFSWQNVLSTPHK